MSAPSRSVNAWILPSENDPQGAGYYTPGSNFQNLVAYGVYKYTDMVNICFANTVPTSSTTVPTGNGSSYTIELETANHPDYTNQQYMSFIMQDARQANPNVKFLITLGYAEDEFSQIFSGPQSGWQQAADDYANNLVAYLQYYDLDGFDVDWEGGFAYATTKEQFQILFTAIRGAFNASGNTYLLTLSPSVVGTLDPDTVNATVDFINLQLYGNSDVRNEFLEAKVSEDLLAYGAKFEVDGDVPYQTAQNAYAGYTGDGYNVITQWRLNSNDFQYEQAQQMILYQLVYGIPGAYFDDTPIVGAAGNPPITQMVVRSGEVLDAIQATNTGSFEQNNGLQYELLQHGGNGGSPSTVQIAGGDSIVEVSGYTGIWFGWNCVLQITIKTANGQTFGPFGTMGNASSKTPFSFTAPAGQSIVAFSGSIVNVPLAGGGMTDIIASLGVSYGVGDMSSVEDAAVGNDAV